MRFVDRLRISIGVSFMVVLLPIAPAAAEQFVLTLNRTSEYSRIDFDQAFQMVWSGTVRFNGAVVGDFTASLLKTILTGGNGTVQQYDLTFLQGTGPVGEFISIRANHSVAGSGFDHGMIFATSPSLRFLVGASAVMVGDQLTVTY